MDCELHTDRVLLDDVSAPYKWSNNNNTNNNKYGAFVGTCIYGHHESPPHCNPNINTEGRGEVFRGEVTSQICGTLGGALHYAAEATDQRQMNRRAERQTDGQHHCIKLPPCGDSLLNKNQFKTCCGSVMP